jgi:hypothetical protein
VQPKSSPTKKPTTIIGCEPPSAYKITSTTGAGLRLQQDQELGEHPHNHRFIRHHAHFTHLASHVKAQSTSLGFPFPVFKTLDHKREPLKRTMADLNSRVFQIG